MTSTHNKRVNPKKNLVNLVSLLSERSGKTYNQLRGELNGHIGYELTRSMFDNYFRQKVDLYTRYPETVILGLVHCFLDGLSEEQRITPLEVFLLINWSNSSLNMIRKTRDLFEKDLFEASLEVFLFELNHDDVEWTPEMLKQIESQIELRCARRKDITASMQGRLSSDLLPIQDLIQQLENILRELKK